MLVENLMVMFPEEEIKPLHDCVYCGDGFFEGDNAYLIDGDYICQECLEENYKIELEKEETE